MKEFIKKNNKHIVIIALIILSGTLTYFLYRASVIRTIQAVRDVGLSIAFYFCSFINVKIPVTVTEFPDLDILRYLPYDFDEILRRLREMWDIIFDGNCFRYYLYNIATTVKDLSIYAMLLLPAILILGWLAVKVLLSPNKKAHGEKSKILINFENKALPSLIKTKNWFLGLFNLSREKWYFFWTILLIWLLNLNILTILLEAIAFYFYFAMAFDFLGIVVQIGKLLVDLFIMLSGAPILAWTAAAYYFICTLRKTIGYKRLNVREAANRQFIKEQPICVMMTGTMGTGKTTMLTDISLSIEVMHREQAYEGLLSVDIRYPNFPWITLEDEVKQAMSDRIIKNLETCRIWVETKYKNFLEDPCPQNIFGYDIFQYRFFFDDGLTNACIWQDLSDYACFYFLYIIKSSLLFSNYSVRVDNVLIDNGNFPLWNSDFFTLSPNESEARSHRAHILDYDAIRLGKRVIENNKNAGVFEFGIVLLSEYGKERGNQLMHQEIKKGDENANQKNDLFNEAIKMCRHKATVRNRCFVAFLADEQRAETLGADLRQLLNIIHIRKKSPISIVTPFFFITELLHDILYPKWQNFYEKYRFNRGDYCLPVYFVRNLMAKFHNYHTKMYNIFGVATLNVEVERGTQDGKYDKAKYFLCSKKVYSDRFSTDCYKGFFEKCLREAELGLADFPEYENTVATTDELNLQNSYFIRDMKNLKS